MASGNQQSTQEINERIRNLQFQPGDLIAGRYEYICEVGHYSLGVVFMCRDKHSGGHTVVLKTVPDVLRHNEEEAQVLMQEFDIVYRLHHDCIPALCSMVEDENRFYVVMDYAPGMTLEKYFTEHRHSSPETVFEIVRRLASALDYVHGKGMLHLNVKPKNVLVDIDDKGNLKSVSLLDLALGQQIRDSYNRATGSKAVTGGMSEYKAPEQWKNLQATAATDQYALAVVAYELLAGRSPLSGGTAEALKKAVLEELPKCLTNVPNTVNEALIKALAKDPAKRYGSCMDFVQALKGQPLSQAKKTGGSKQQAETSSAGGNGKTKLIAVAAVAAVVIIAILAVVLLGGKKAEEDKPDEPIAAVSRPKVEAEPETSPAEEEKAAEPEEPEKSAQPLSAEEIKQRQDVLILQSAVERLQKKLAEMKLERGQTFGEHLDIFMDQNKSGIAAVKNKEYAVATLCFEAARKEYAWLEENAKPRQEAASTFAEVYKFASELNRNNVQKYAAASYEKAVKTLEEGREAFEKGEFAKALEGFGVARGMFKGALTEMKDIHLSELVSDAEKAEASGKEEDWQKVFKLAKEMQVMDGETAKKWMDKVDKHLPTKLLLVAKVDGREVEASLDGTDETTPWTSAVLPMGEKVSHHLSWWKNNEEYIADISETVNWKGRKERIVTLRKKVLNLRGGWLMLPGNLKLDLVKVEKGTFEMGGGKHSTEDAHRVVITRDYWIGKYEVTQAQWKAMGVNKRKACYWEGDSLPVENVTWNEAMAFCEQLNQLAVGLLPEGYHFTLPTEAEWEYAARGGNKSRGYEFSGDNNMDKVGWYWNNSGQKTHPVKGKKGKMANELGIYDMSGNVWEWCRDRCEVDPKHLYVITDTYKDGIEDPLCRRGVGRIARGGSWHGSIGICRPSYRSGNEQSDISYSHLGFRVALSPVR